MSAAVQQPDFRGEGDVTGRGTGGPAPLRITVSYGFWIFLLSDIIMFSAFFAAHAVLRGNTNGGPAGRDLFDMRVVAIETACLLFSSYTAGLASLATETRRVPVFFLMSAATFVLGAVFLSLEMQEFSHLVEMGAGPGRSAFLSSFFALVGLHGVHVAAGLLWLVYLLAQVAVKGPQDWVLRRVSCFGLFWHALDIVWVGVFTLVYLLGMG